MPFPFAAPAAAAAISGGSSLLGGMLNSNAQREQNRHSELWSERMYNRQYQDNIRFWQMQNEYNSPQAQMKRFQDAGLNPHLIYGQGNSGNASPVQTPDVQTPQFRSPEPGNAIMGGGLAFINAIYDLDIKAAQADNLKAQNGVIQQEQLLKLAQTANTLTGEEGQRFKLDFEKELRSTSADARKEQLRQLQIQNSTALDRNAREAAMNSSNLTEAVQRMALMQEQKAKSQQERAQIRENIKQMQLDGTLKQLDIDLKRMGINPADPTWLRVVGRLLTNIFDNPTPRSVTGGFWDWFTR